MDFRSDIECAGPPKQDKLILIYILWSHQHHKSCTYQEPKVCTVPYLMYKNSATHNPDFIDNATLNIQVVMQTRESTSCQVYCLYRPSTYIISFQEIQYLCIIYSLKCSKKLLILIIIEVFSSPDMYVTSESNQDFESRMEGCPKLEGGPGGIS